MTCPTCNSSGFATSSLGPDRCEFCDGTFGGNPPEPAVFIIPADESDLHTLDITRSADLIWITTNNRKMYQKWGTLAWDTSMARQLISGLEAVLAGAPRACTQMQLDQEANEKMLNDAARAKYAAQAAATDPLNYDDLFGESNG